MTLELILGPMFCGKTEELIRRINREIVVDKIVIAFKHSVDIRFSPEYIVSHSRGRIKATSVKNASQIYKHLKNKNAKVIGIDEIQFFDEKIIDFCIDYANNPNVKVIASGLNLDFKREPFKFNGSTKHIGEIMPYASITNLRAKCTYFLEHDQKCNMEADYSQRLVNGKPAHYDDQLIVVGAKESYAARCLKHHFIPGKDDLHTHYWKNYHK